MPAPIVATTVLLLVSMTETLPTLLLAT